MMLHHLKYSSLPTPRLVGPDVLSSVQGGDHTL